MLRYNCHTAELHDNIAQLKWVKQEEAWELLLNYAENVMWLYGSGVTSKNDSTINKFCCGKL